MRGDRDETTPVLELAAGTGLEAIDAGGDAVLDSGVVADLEMEMAHLAKRAPVATVEGAGLLHVDGSRNDLALLACDDEAQVALPPLAQELEELPIQILLPPVQRRDRRLI